MRAILARGFQAFVVFAIAVGLAATPAFAAANISAACDATNCQTVLTSLSPAPAVSSSYGLRLNHGTNDVLFNNYPTLGPRFVSLGGQQDIFVPQKTSQEFAAFLNSTSSGATIDYAVAPGSYTLVPDSAASSCGTLSSSHPPSTVSLPGSVSTVAVNSYTLLPAADATNPSAVTTTVGSTSQGGAAQLNYTRTDCTAKDNEGNQQCQTVYFQEDQQLTFPATGTAPNFSWASSPSSISDGFYYSTDGKSYSSGGCAATYPPALNGVCGSANGVDYTATPTANLCSYGNAGSVTPVSGVTDEWQWTCSGLSNGSSASCKTGVTCASVVNATSYAAYPGCAVTGCATGYTPSSDGKSCVASCTTGWSASVASGSPATGWTNATCSSSSTSQTATCTNGSWNFANWTTNYPYSSAQTATGCTPVCGNSAYSCSAGSVVPSTETTDSSYKGVVVEDWTCQLGSNTALCAYCKSADTGYAGNYQVVESVYSLAQYTCTSTVPIASGPGGTSSITSAAFASQQVLVNGECYWAYSNNGNGPEVMFETIAAADSNQANCIYENLGNDNLCYEGQYWNGSACVCNNGGTWNGSSCECSNGSAPNSTVVDYFNASQSLCPSTNIHAINYATAFQTPATAFGGECYWSYTSTPASLFWTVWYNDPNQGKCLGNNIGASCSSGQSWNGSTCCPGATWQGANCVCPSGQIWSTSSFSCVTPVNGSCGSSQYGCNSGTASSESDNGAQSTWTCQGSNGGTSSTCSSNDAQYNACGSGGCADGNGNCLTPPASYSTLVCYYGALNGTCSSGQSWTQLVIEGGACYWAYNGGTSGFYYSNAWGAKQRTCMYNSCGGP